MKTKKQKIPKDLLQVAKLSYLARLSCSEHLKTKDILPNKDSIVSRIIDKE